MSQTILEAFKYANAEAGIKEFRLARIDEFQAFMDSFKSEQYPINVVIPFTVNGSTNRNTGMRTGVIPIQGWVMTRIKEDPVNLRSEKGEELYVSPMRQLAAKFIKNLLSTEIVDHQPTAIGDSIKPEYMFLNAHTLGVSYTMNLPIIANVC